MGVFEDAVKEFDEVLEVVKTAVISHQGRKFRIEVERNYSNDKIKYSAGYWELRNVFVTPEFDERGTQYSGSPVRMRIWQQVNLPWVARDSADGAMSQALGFLLSTNF